MQDKVPVWFCVSTAPGGSLAGVCCLGRPPGRASGHAGELPGPAGRGPLPGGLDLPPAAVLATGTATPEPGPGEPMGSVTVTSLPAPAPQHSGPGIHLPRPLHPAQQAREGQGDAGGCVQDPARGFTLCPPDSHVLRPASPLPCPSPAGHPMPTHGHSGRRCFLSQACLNRPHGPATGCCVQ